MKKYSIASQDYLQRAFEQLDAGSSASLFYAAFELRSGIEARMHEYLEAWDHISKKKKKGWKVAQSHRNIEEAFRIGNNVVRWAVHDSVEGQLLVCMYHTPVTSRLKRDAEKLGNYVHSMKKFREPEDGWWIGFRTDLSEIAGRLQTATTGTLLGPPLIKTGTRNVYVRSEVPPHVDGGELLKLVGQQGQQLVVKVDYLAQFPKELEPEAIVWWAGR